MLTGGQGQWGCEARAMPALSWVPEAWWSPEVEPKQVARGRWWVLSRLTRLPTAIPMRKHGMGLPTSPGAPTQPLAGDCAQVPL